MLRHISVASPCVPCYCRSIVSVNCDCYWRWRWSVQVLGIWAKHVVLVCQDYCVISLCLVHGAPGRCMVFLLLLLARVPYVLHVLKYLLYVSWYLANGELYIFRTDVSWPVVGRTVHESSQWQLSQMMSCVSSWLYLSVMMIVGFQYDCDLHLSMEKSFVSQVQLTCKKHWHLFFPFDGYHDEYRSTVSVMFNTTVSRR